MRGEGRSRPEAEHETAVVVGSARRERAIAEIAARQRGVVTRAQLLSIGLTSGAIDHRLAAARLHAIYRGVYLVGHAVPVEGARALAAVLACGRGAVLSHRSAAVRWRLLPDSPGELHVTLPVASASQGAGSAFIASQTSRGRTSVVSAEYR